MIRLLYRIGALRNHVLRKNIQSHWSHASKLKKLIYLCTGLLLIAIISLPNVKELAHVQYQVPLQIYSKDEKLIAYFGEKKRFPVQLSAIPLTLQQAFIAAEDQRFYHHIGIDWFGLARASTALVLKHGKITQGASTITMQVARNFYLNNRKTFARKFHEILLSLKIEQSLSKDQILELYLNKIYLGERAYGVAAASQVYYGKPLAELSLAESAMLAGLPKAPSANNPIKNPTRALKRRNYVLNRMAQLGYISTETSHQAQLAPLTAKLHAPQIELYAPHAAELIRQIMVKRLGEDAYTQGLKVYTSLESPSQKAANTAIHQGLIAYTKRHGFRGPITTIDEETWQQEASSLHEPPDLKVARTIDSNSKTATLELKNGDHITLYLEGNLWARKKLAQGYRGKEPQAMSDLIKENDLVYVMKSGKKWVLAQAPEAQASLVALDSSTGAVKALVGGYDYFMSHYNRITQAKRQSGSVFKPFIYASALDQGLTLASIINDSPIIQQDSHQSTWRPKNSTEKFNGPTRLRQGLVLSRNLVSIRLLDKIGIKPTIASLTRYGFIKEDLPASLSLSLGASAHTPIELARGFAVFANGGQLITPHLIDHITQADEGLWYQSHPPEACDACANQAPRVLDEGTAYLMNQTLLDVIEHGTGRQAKSLKRKDLGGKTGTTNDQKDAWFIGFNRDLVASVWVGFDQPKSLHEYGAQAALPIWTAFMGKALKNKPNALLKRPASIISARINPNTGEKLQHREPGSIFELFKAS